MNWLLKTPEVKSVAEIRAPSWDQLPCMPIRSDPTMEPVEKEFSLNTHGTNQYFEVDAHHPTAIRGLLRQSEFEVSKLMTKSIRGKEYIVGLQGRLPISCLHIGAARKRKTLSAVFGRRSKTRNDLKREPVTQITPQEPVQPDHSTFELAAGEQGDL